MIPVWILATFTTIFCFLDDCATQAPFTSFISPQRDANQLPEVVPVSLPPVGQGQLEELVKAANETVTQRLDAVEEVLKAGGAKLRPGTAEWFLAVSSRTTTRAKNVARIALVSEEATRLVAHTLGLSKSQIAYGLPTLDIQSTLLGATCPEEVDFPCQPRKYRAHSGYCNNVQSPRWGNANTKYLRFLTPDYADGVSVPRQAKDGRELASGWQVSSVVHSDADRPQPYVTSLLAFWGQWISLDLAHTAQVSGPSGEPFKCCGVAAQSLHPECFPVIISASTNPRISKVDCQDYVRSCMGPRTGCTLGPREQVNQVTAFLDASVIYGSSEEDCKQLRTFESGTLRIQPSPGSYGGLLPVNDDLFDCRSNGHFRCFKAGDMRINEHVGLVVLQTLWVREHNRLAELLKVVNPHWIDEPLFQEARRIVAAQIQHVTYNEFLPVLLGEDVISRYGLRLKSGGHYMDYDINVNSGVANSLATSALRFFVTLLPSAFELHDSSHVKVGQKPISSTFYSPGDLYDSRKFGQYVMGMVDQSAQSADEFVSEELTTRYMSNSSGIGVDWVALILQQGRDHGINGYVKWRQFCGQSVAKTFEQLRDVMTPETIQRLSSAYQNVEDVDLFTGGMSEVPNKGALLGPTFSCLLGKQFSNLRKGDRFWYENDLPPSSFTKDQLAEIRKVTLARVICDNANAVRSVQPKVMLAADPFLNAIMDCAGDAFPSINLKKWKTASTNFAISSDVIEDALERAKRQVDEFASDELRRFSENIGIVDDKSPSGASSALLKPKRQAIEISNHSRVLQFATQRFVSNFMLEHLKDMESGGETTSPRLHDVIKILPNIDVSEYLDIPRVFECDEQTLPCDHTSTFRTFTGWCNNLDKPALGKTFTVFGRLVAPQYADGLSAPRSLSVTGSKLPSPRLVTINAHPDLSHPHVRYTLMVMQFAQILDHDLTFTPVHTGFEGAILGCGSCDSPKSVHPECFPIEVPADDPHFPPINSTHPTPRCLALIRSLPGQLTLGPRQQINQATAFVDASIVYGSDVCVAKQLRAFVGGRLNSTRHPSGGKDLLPETDKIKECRTVRGLCFKAGDDRPSEQPALTAMHTILLREHNRIVGSLARVNPHWNDEKLYQTGRRILGAVFQQITYREFLPRILGWEATHTYSLQTVDEGYFDGYDSTCDPTIVNEFSTAAFRFGHSLIRPQLIRLDPFFTNLGSLALKHRFFDSDDLYTPGMVDELMRGLATASMEGLDPFITSSVTNHLFEDRVIPFSGLDLVALNLQRAREHGIGTYNQIRVLCNMTRALRFEDLTREISQASVQRLRRVYAHPDDIDLFTGGMLETALHGGVVGPTFACVIGQQFSLLRRCDRFWFENSDPLVRFTQAQLTEIRKASLAKVVCENSDTVDTIQRSIFDLPNSFLNPRVPCQILPAVNFDAWRERTTCNVGSVTISAGLSERVSPCVMCTCTREGPLCQSLKVVDCTSLAEKFSPDAILQDHVCKVQCAFAFRALPQVNGADSLLGIDSISPPS